MADYIKSLKIGGVNKQIDYEALANKPTIPSEVTETTVSGWGFAKSNTVQSTLSDTDGGYGQRIKAIEDALAAAIDFDAQSY